jgi:hypothetical protein
MYNPLLSREENEEIAATADMALEYVREHGEFPRGLRAWHLFALRELMEKEKDFSYMLDMAIVEGRKRGPQH